MPPMIPTDPVINRILTTIVQLAMAGILGVLLRMVWECEKEDPFVIPVTWTHPELRRERAKMAARRRARARRNARARRVWAESQRAQRTHGAYVMDNARIRARM